MNIVVSEYSSGYAHYTYCLCNELAKYNNINVTYLSDENNTYFDSTTKEVKTVKLFDAFEDDEKHKKGSLRWAANRLLVTIKNCYKRNKYVKKYKPDITLVQMTMSSIEQYFVNRIKKYTKLAYTVHDVVVPFQSFSWSFKSLKRVYDYADKLIVHTIANKNQLISEFNVPAEKIEIVHLGIELSYVKKDKGECRRKLGIHDDEKVLLFYGGIRDSKGLDILIKAMNGIDATLIIAGALPFGKTFDQYRKLINDNHVKTVEYIEFTDDSFRDILFQASDYLALPYKEFSSQSAVLMQGIKYLLPVIASDVGAFKEYIDLYNIGFCCKANSVEDLHRKIEDALLSNVNFEGNMKKALDENSWEKSGFKYKEVLLNM